jgi:hypothetical protein
MIQVVIIGAGKGGTALLKALHNDPLVKITGVADRNRKAEGFQLAKGLGIYTTTRYEQLLEKQGPDLIIDATGDPSVRLALKGTITDGVEVIGGLSARFMWQLLDERTKGKEEAERLLAEYQSLYSLGVKLTASESIEKLYMMIVEYALKLTDCPAGSLAVFDEKSGEMYLGAVKGFSKNFSRKQRWQIRKGGLTSTILNQKIPLTVSDVNQFPNFDNPLIERQ